MATEAPAIKQTEIILDKLVKLNEIVDSINRYSTELNGDGSGDENRERPTSTGSLGRIEMTIDEITHTAVQAMKKLEQV